MFCLFLCFSFYRIGMFLSPFNLYTFNLSKLHSARLREWERKDGGPSVFCFPPAFKISAHYELYKMQMKGIHFIKPRSFQLQMEF